jgi:hypothetical protein
MPSWAGVTGGHQILDAYVPLIRDFAVKPRSATRQGFDPGLSWRKYRQLPSISGRNGYVWTCFSMECPPNFPGQKSRNIDMELT